MKKLGYSFIAAGAGQPIKQGTLKHVQEAFQEPIDWMCRAIFGTTSGVSILYGCVNSTAVGSTYTISAGAVYYAGEVYLVDAVTATRAGNVLVATIATTFYTDATADPVTFTDNNTHNVHEIRKVVLALAASGSGIADYVNFNSDRWHDIGSTFAEITEPAFENGWGNTGGADSTARFKLEKNGKFVTIAGTVTGGANNTIVFTLPSGYRPTKLVYFIAPIPGDTAKLADIAINSVGSVNIKYVAGAGSVSLSGIRFPID